MYVIALQLLHTLACRKHAYHIDLDNSIHVSYFSIKTYVVGTQQKCLTEALLLSNHSICFCGEKKAMNTMVEKKSAFSGAMLIISWPEPALPALFVLVDLLVFL